MKTLIYTSIVAVLLLGSSVLRAQEKPNEYLGLPGDNLNLYAVMNLFQESETLEGFEKSLNDPEKMVNNLDLNSDNKVDYIMVLDYNEENIHNIVLRVAINKDENQDVAVFVVEKRSDGSARVQLIGDEILYGKDYIIEPAYAETPNPGYNGNASQNKETVVTTTYYEVASWPVIVYVYEPSYVVWNSSWYWGCYTPYWHSWTPHYWHYYHGYHHNWNSHYHAHYRHRNHNRHDDYHHGYAHNRIHSNTVTANIHSGRYSNTYSRPDRKEDGNRHFTNKFPTGIAEKPLNNNQNKPIANKPNRITKPDETGRITIPSENDRKPVREKPQVTEQRPIREISSTKPARNRLSEPARTEERPATRPSVPRRTEERPAVRLSEPVRTNERPYTRPSEPVRNEERPAARPSVPTRTEERPATRPERPNPVSVPSEPRRDNSNSSSGSNSRPAVRENSSSNNVQNSNGGSAPKQSSPSGSSSPKSNDKPNKGEGRKR